MNVFRDLLRVSAVIGIVAVSAGAAFSAPPGHAKGPGKASPNACGPGTAVFCAPEVGATGAAAALALLLGTATLMSAAAARRRRR